MIQCHCVTVIHKVFDGSGAVVLIEHLSPVHHIDPLSLGELQLGCAWHFAIFTNGNGFAVREAQQAVMIFVHIIIVIYICCENVYLICSRIGQFIRIRRGIWSIGVPHPQQVV
ncbi:hypothetical protein D3C75_982210 [compost metagenome]